MSHKIHVLPFRSQHGKQSESCANGNPGAAAACCRSPLPGHGAAAENTNSAKNCRRGAHRDMGRTMKHGIGEVSSGSRQQNQNTSEPRAQRAGGGPEEEGSSEGIADRVNRIGMQG